ncbi:SH2 domain-containing protein 3A isoform X2 [Lepidochelys kempii]
MELAKEKLRKELEEELKLSTEELRSHAWYHGCLPREEAESLLGEDGDFLIRDSGSSQGDYVLSCRWRGETLHFKIIRVVLRPRQGYSRTLFQFEQDQFDNVPALVRFYVGNCKPISETSGAVVSRPLNRDVPLRWLQERYGATGQPRLDEQEPAEGDAAPAQRLGRHRLTAGEMPTEGNLLRVKDRSGSQPTGLDQLGRRPLLYTAQSDSNLRTGSPEAPAGTQEWSKLPPPSPVFRTGSDPVLRPPAPRCLDPEGGAALSGSEGQLHSRAPPKPLRAPSMLVGDAPQEQPSTYCELVPKAPAGLRSHVARLHTEEKWRGRARATDTAFGFLEDEGVPLPRPRHYEEDFVRPLLETASSFQPHSFPSLLLPPDNKPLEPGALKRLKDLFTRHDCRTMALHVLYMDCLVSRITRVPREQQQAMGVSSGLELITLPHGHQLRLDLLESPLRCLCPFQAPSHGPGHRGGHPGLHRGRGGASRHPAQDRPAGCGAEGLGRGPVCSVGRDEGPAAAPGCAAGSDVAEAAADPHRERHRLREGPQALRETPQPGGRELLPRRGRHPSPPASHQPHGRGAALGRPRGELRPPLTDAGVRPLHRHQRRGVQSHRRGQAPRIPSHGGAPRSFPNRVRAPLILGQQRSGRRPGRALQEIRRHPHGAVPETRTSEENGALSFLHRHGTAHEQWLAEPRQDGGATAPHCLEISPLAWPPVPVAGWGQGNEPEPKSHPGPTAAEDGGYRDFSGLCPGSILPAPPAPCCWRRLLRVQKLAGVRRIGGPIAPTAF